MGSRKKSKASKPRKASKASVAKAPKIQTGEGAVDISTPDAFCEAWQAAPSLANLAASTGVNVRTLTGRAATYRKRSIKLKFFRSGGNRYTDWDALAAKHGDSSPVAKSRARVAKSDQPAAKRGASKSKRKAA